MEISDHVTPEDDEGKFEMNVPGAKIYLREATTYLESIIIIIRDLSAKELVQKMRRCGTGELF